MKTNNNNIYNNNRTLHIALKTSAAKMYVKCEYCYFRGQSGTPFSNSSRSMALALFFKTPNLFSLYSENYKTKLKQCFKVISKIYIQRQSVLISCKNDLCKKKNLYTNKHQKLQLFENNVKCGLSFCCNLIHKLLTSYLALVS